VSRSRNDRLSNGAPLRWRCAEEHHTVLPPTSRRPARRLSRRNPLPEGASCPRTDPSRTSPSCLWIKRIGDRTVGLLRLVQSEPQAARIVTFRIDPDWYHTTVVSDLIRAVQDHCLRRACFRVLVDFRVAPPWLPSILRRHGFRVAWHHHAWEAVLDRPVARDRFKFPKACAPALQ
jgi:hypothetical protein